MIQQNGISSIPFGNSFSKLRDLRLDRNHLTSVEPLSICSNLRTLNISWNKLISLEVLHYPLCQFSLEKYLRLSNIGVGWITKSAGVISES